MFGQMIFYSSYRKLELLQTTLVQLIRDPQLLENDRTRCLTNLAREQQLVQNQVDLVEVEHQVQLAHVAEVAVEELHLFDYNQFHEL